MLGVLPCVVGSDHVGRWQSCRIPEFLVAPPSEWEGELRQVARIQSISHSSGGDSMTKRSGPIVAVIVVGVVALFAFIVFVSSYTQIDFGKVGMVTRFGRITGRIMDPGLNWKAPFVDRVIIYRTQEIVYITEEQVGEDNVKAGTYVDYPTDTTTADGQQIAVKYSVRFRIDSTKITRIANEIGDEEALVDKVVKFHTRILARNIPKEYEALDLYTGKIQAVQVEFERQLRPLLAEKGVILEAFGLRQIDFQDDYVQAIEQKQIEAENVKTEQNRADQAKWRAQSVIEEAKGTAQATIENARGDAEEIKLLAEGNAEKIMVIAEAEAEAIRLKGEVLALYPEIISLEFVNSLKDPDSNVSWGIMPQEGIVPFLDVNPGSTK
jgi:regulator of protease activity HflC (stomatin/prohibitin superfamily)